MGLDILQMNVQIHLHLNHVIIVVEFLIILINVNLLFVRNVDILDILNINVKLENLNIIVFHVI